MEICQICKKELKSMHALHCHVGHAHMPILEYKLKYYKEDLCYYGCGQKAIYYFKTANRWSCSKHHSQCPSVIEKMSSEIKEVWQKEDSPYRTEEFLNKISDSGKKSWDSDRRIEAAERAKKMWREDEYRKSKEYKDLIGSKSKKMWQNLSDIEREEYIKKLRVSSLERIQERLKDGHQITPNYNPAACILIDEYGEQNNFKFQHAMNGGEFHIKELGYWVDGYDPEKNVVVEVDEPHHFNADGNLCKRDVRRQSEITEYLERKHKKSCVFIRLRI